MGLCYGCGGDRSLSLPFMIDSCIDRIQTALIVILETW